VLVVMFAPRGLAGAWTDAIARLSARPEPNVPQPKEKVGAA